MIKIEKNESNQYSNEAENNSLNLQKLNLKVCTYSHSKYAKKEKDLPYKGFNIEDIREFNNRPKILSKFIQSKEKDKKQNKYKKNLGNNSLKYTLKKNPFKNNEIVSNYHYEVSSDLKSENTHLSNIEFFINNNKKNAEFKLKNNTITTTKYNIFTFLPKGLLFQFSRLPNLYFLFITIIQSIPIISPLNSLTAIIPLIFVLSVSMIRELIEDLPRNKFDKMSNNEEVIVLREGKFIKSKSKTLKHGEIILIYENDPIPADMVLLDSGMGDGQCYVETSSLDGEKALKLKIANQKIVGLISKRIDNENKNIKIHKIKDLMNFDISGFIQVIPPNANLNQIEGRLNIFVMENNLISKEENFSLNIKEFILKGSILKNTNWIVGVVIYTGMSNKIILNSKKPRMKISQIEIKMNYCLIGVFCFLVASSLFYSYYHYFLYKKHNKFYGNFVPLDKSVTMYCFINFFTYFLLFNTLIPISLIVTLEIIKLAQGLFIYWDTKLYSHTRHCFSNAKTVSIIEELGMVNFIFSDKTGTLTQNKLSFKFCIIGNKLYKNFEGSNEFKKRTSQVTNVSVFNKKMDKLKSIAKRVDESYLLNYIKKCKVKIEECEDNGKVEMLNKIYYDKKALEDDIYYINEFLIALALANECMVDNRNNNLSDEVKYTGTSSDDLELVKFAANQGYKLIKTTFDEKVILVGTKHLKFKILQSLNFSSERKRMSIIVEDQRGTIKIYTKGADMEISKRLSQKSRYSENFNITIHDMEYISNLGYRTLMVAYREISRGEYIKWKEKFHLDDLNDGKSTKIIEQSYENIERNFELLGATIVEDKLQDEVPETIQKLRFAKIKFWVLTGDKMNTAVNIGYSCNLISNDQKIFKLQINKEQNTNIKFESNIQINKFFTEFNNFLKNLAIKYNIIPEDSMPPIVKNNINLNSNLNEISSNSESNPEEILNLALFKSLERRKINEPYSVIIEAPILIALFDDELQTEKFLSICYNSNSVLCCRVSPFQKSQIVQKMKQFAPDSVTLAIGDGSNDVSMIIEANVGVGIVGEEGMNAAKASDFSIGEFKLLKRLLFFHGRNNLNRISKMILYFFYKNIIFTVAQLYFGPFSLLSGQTIMDDWYITCYNLIFTAIPLSIAALTDVDIVEDEMNKEGKDMSILYKESRDDKIIFNRKTFIIISIKGVLVSFIMFITCINHEILGNKGHISDLWYISLLYYLSILFVVTNNLFFLTQYIVFILVISVIITTFMFLVVFLIFVHYGLVFDFKSKASIIPSIKNFSFYIYLFFLLGFNLVLDYTLKIRTFFFDKGLSTKLSRQRTFKGQRKALYKMMINKNCDLNNNEISGLNLISSKYSSKKIDENENISKLNRYNLSKLSEVKEQNEKNEIIYSIKNENKFNEKNDS